MSHADVSVKITLDNRASGPLLEAQVAVMLTRAGAILRRWMSEERTDGPAALAPNAIVAFGPDLAERFETTPAAEAPAELIEAARTITAFEDELDGEGRPPCIPDHGVPVWCPGCAYDNDRDEPEGYRRPRPGDRYRRVVGAGRLVEVESLLNVGEKTSVEFRTLEGDAGLVPSGFARSMPIAQFLGEYELVKPT